MEKKVIQKWREMARNGEKKEGKIKAASLV